MAIDIGAGAIDRTTSSGGDLTWIDLTNPANATGSLDTVEIWANQQLEGCEVATFYTTTDYSTRDSELIGTVTAGSKQTFSGLSIDVSTNDYLGLHHTGGYIERSSSGGSGVKYKAGDYIPCTNETGWSTLADDSISTYGTGTEGAPPPTFTPRITGII